MLISRRTAMKAAGAASLELSASRLTNLFAESPLAVVSRGNPIFPGLGACDPQVRVYDDHVYMYATHDALKHSKDFVMHDWWVWHTTDLVHWEMESVLKPEQTYFRKPSSQCWATDAARRDGKYYFYFSMGPENIGVVEGPGPAGPWHDPLGHALIAKGTVQTEARDPGILQEADGTSYIVFGTFDYYIARLKRDMTSLAEKPRRIRIVHPEGPYGKGRTDDKPFLHKRGGRYYLSWGCYYGVSDSPYGPFDCRGSIIRANRLSPEFRSLSNETSPYGPPANGRPKDWLGYDRHGSFFELHGQWYFICNDQALPGSNTHFRNSVLTYVRYKKNGDIDPVWLDSIGVGQYDARRRIAATNFFKAANARVEETGEDRFQVCGLREGSYLVYPRIRNLRERPRLSVTASVMHADGARIDVLRDGPEGTKLGQLVVKSNPNAGAESTHTVLLHGLRDEDNLCLVFHGGKGEIVRFSHLEFS